MTDETAAPSPRFPPINDEELLKIREEARGQVYATELSTWKVYSEQVHEERMKLLDASVSYGSGTIKMLMIFNAGAIVALLTLTGSFFTRNDQTLLLIGISIVKSLQPALYSFAGGLVAAALASSLAYVNFSYATVAQLTPAELYSAMNTAFQPETRNRVNRLTRATALLSVGATIMGFILFITGCLHVASAFRVLGA